jgi:hypothetical protein
MAYACPWTEESRERRSAARWRVDADYDLEAADRKRSLIIQVAPIDS